jgi:Predicted nucleotide-binding protein containing TIR-like domain
MRQDAPKEKPGPWLANVFVAYAHEDGMVAGAIRDAMRAYSNTREGGTINVNTWEVKAELSKSILESVQSNIEETDFGVFIYSSVDVKARDNVVFETGLCMGMKDANHTFLMLPENADVTPSDLRGFIGVEYPTAELKNIENAKRVEMFSTAGATIVDKIYRVMVENPPNQEQPGAGQPRSDASAAQPSGALEMIRTGLKLEAALGRLTTFDGRVWPGKLVVHAASGLGQIVGFDPPEAVPRYVEVQFGSVIARCRTTDLFEAPIDLK